jgi:hypothetical protein
MAAGREITDYVITTVFIAVFALSVSVSWAGGIADLWAVYGPESDSGGLNRIGTPVQWLYDSDGTLQATFTNRFPASVYMKTVYFCCYGIDDVEIVVNKYVKENEDFTVSADICDTGDAGDPYAVRTILEYDSKDFGATGMSERFVLTGQMG